MSYCSATSRPCAVWHRVDGSPDTITALVHNAVKSPCTVACSLCVTSRHAQYYRRLGVSISSTHLMLPICRIWLTCTHLMCCVLHVLGEVMISLMSGVLGMHMHASEAGGPNQVFRPTEYFPFACGTPRAMCHVATPEPFRTGRRV
jgi:hypothetical protein